MVRALRAPGLIRLMVVLVAVVVRLSVALVPVVTVVGMRRRRLVSSLLLWSLLWRSLL